MLFFISNLFITYARRGSFTTYYIFAIVCPIALVCIYLHSTKLTFQVKLYFNTCLAILGSITAIYWVDSNNAFDLSLAASFFLILILTLFLALAFTYLFHFILHTEIKGVVKDWGPTLLIAVIFGLNLNPAIARALDVRGDSALMVVSSESMEPTFYKGDVILIKGVDEDDVNEDDVIVYNSPKEDVPIVHRVVMFQNDSNGTVFFVTQGDNRVTNPINDTVAYNPDGDRLAPTEYGAAESDTVGKVIFVIPIIGWVKIIFTGGV